MKVVKPEGVMCREQLHCLSIALDDFLQVLRVSIFIKACFKCKSKIVERVILVGVKWKSLLQCLSIGASLL